MFLSTTIIRLLLSLTLVLPRSTSPKYKCNLDLTLTPNLEKRKLRHGEVAATVQAEACDSKVVIKDGATAKCLRKWLKSDCTRLMGDKDRNTYVILHTNHAGNTDHRGL